MHPSSSYDVLDVREPASKSDSEENPTHESVNRHPDCLFTAYSDVDAHDETPNQERKTERQSITKAPASLQLIKNLHQVSSSDDGLGLGIEGPGASGTGTGTIWA